MVDKAALGQVFSECFGFLCQSHCTNFSIIMITRGWHNRSIGGRSAEWTQLESTPHLPIKKNCNKHQELPENLVEILAAVFDEKRLIFQAL
jgi:hypothetical protein